MSISSIGQMISPTPPAGSEAGNRAPSHAALPAGPAPAAAAVTTLQASAVRAAPSAASVNPDPDSERLEEATRQVAEAVQSRASNLVFSLDDDSGRTVVKIIDAQTDELIRQIPSEEILALAKAIEEYQGSRSILLADQA